MPESHKPYGRPKKQPKDKLTARINVPVTDAAFDDLCARARQARMGLNEYMREVIAHVQAGLLVVKKY